MKVLVKDDQIWVEQGDFKIWIPVSNDEAIEMCSQILAQIAAKRLPKN